MVPGGAWRFLEGPGGLYGWDRDSHLGLTLMWTKKKKKKAIQVTVDDSIVSLMESMMDAKVSASHRMQMMGKEHVG